MSKKKIGAVVLALAMAMSLCTTAFATVPKGSITTVDSADNKNQQQIDVSGMYDGSKAEVYSVDISWGGMVFTYTAADNVTWDPVSHTYKNSDGESGTWSYGTAPAAGGLAGNEVKVENHSNKAVNAALKFEKVPSVIGTYTGTFTYAKDTTVLTDSGSGLTLAAGVENSPTTADYFVATLTLDGTLSPDHNSETKLGTITATISEVQ